MKKVILSLLFCIVGVFISSASYSMTPEEFFQEDGFWKLLPEDETMVAAGLYPSSAQGRFETDFTFLVEANQYSELDKFFHSYLKQFEELTKSWVARLSKEELDQFIDEWNKHTEYLPGLQPNIQVENLDDLLSEHTKNHIPGISTSHLDNISGNVKMAAQLYPMLIKTSLENRDFEKTRKHFLTWAPLIIKDILLDRLMKNIPASCTGQASKFFK